MRLEQTVAHDTGDRGTPEQAALLLLALSDNATVVRNDSRASWAAGARTGSALYLWADSHRPRLVDGNDLAPEGHQRDGDELEVPEPKWNPDDRQA